MTHSIPHKSFRMPAPGKWLLDKNRPEYVPSHKTNIKDRFYDELARIEREKLKHTKLKVAA